MDIPFVNVVNNHVRVAPTHKHWTSNEWAPLPCGRGNLRLAFLGLIPALKCFGGGRRSRAGLKAALKVTEEAVEKPRWKAKRLRKPTGALRKWGGVGFKIRQDGLAFRPQVFQEEQATKVKWKPKRENWQAWVTDDEGTEAFGPLAVGHEVEFLQGRSRMESAEKWVAGVVTNMSTESGVQQAKLALSTGQTKIVDLGRGLLRRSEDAQELCAEKDIAQMAKLRTLKRPKELMQFGLGQKAVSSRSQAIYSLVRMGRDGIRCAEELLSEVKPWDVSSTAIRELAHSHARMGDVKSAMRHVDVFDEVHSAQLLIEILALGLTGTILKEREKLGSNFLTGVETNPVVQGAGCRHIFYRRCDFPLAAKLRKRLDVESRSVPQAELEPRRRDAEETDLGEGDLDSELVQKLRQRRQVVNSQGDVFLKEVHIPQEGAETKEVRSTAEAPENIHNMVPEKRKRRFWWLFCCSLVVAAYGAYQSIAVE